MRLRLDFAGGRYGAAKRPRASWADISEVRAIGAGGVALSPTGVLHLTPAGQPRIVPGVGMLIEPASRNVLAIANAAPIGIGGYTLNASRPAGATITVVDDRASLEAAGVFGELLNTGVMNGKVIRLYNPSPDTDFIVPFYFSVGGRTLASSAYVRCVSGSGNITVTGGGGATPAFTGTHWRRVGRVHSGGQQARFVIAPGSDVRVILLQLEPDRITSPIITTGQPADRVAESLTVDALHWLGKPHTVIAEVDIDRQDNVDRRLFTLAAIGGEMAVARGADGTLGVASTTSRWRPRIARVAGPGRLRCALRVSARGWVLAAGGMTRHDPWRAPPAALSRLIVGAASDGSAPINGWVRSVEIVGEIGDAALDASAAPPAQAMAIDAVRYVTPGGSDAADGATPATAWATLARAAQAGAMVPGSELRLARGGAWTETLLPMTGCTYRAHGVGAAPAVGGGLFGVDENGASLWRLDGLKVRGASQRGVNAYGGSAIVIDACEVTGNGSKSDANSIAVAVRGNTRAAAIAVQSVPSTVTITARAATEAALTGVFRATCTVGGSGAAVRWQVKRPDGSVAGTATGGTSFSAAGISFTATGTASAGDVIELRTLPFSEIAFPPNALAEDVAIRRCHVHDNTGSAAGDGVYVEGVGGVVIVEGCNIPAPDGQRADCIQISRCDRKYVAKPTHAIVRHNAMVASQGSGKGALVVRAETCLIESNRIFGQNFCIGVMVAAGGIVRWNTCVQAALYDYSWGIGPGEDNDVIGLEIYENTITDCNRGIAVSGIGTSTMTVDGRIPRTQQRVDLVARDNVIERSVTAIFIDRPTSGSITGNTTRDCARIADRRTAVVPPGGRFDALTLAYNPAA